MPGWERTTPAIYSIVTGFFPEASPKDTWATNPRPLLVCGTAKDSASGTIFCRIAYGTTKNLDKAHRDDLVIGNLAVLDKLNLKHPTRFVIFSGRQMVIMPWTSEFFRPWSNQKTPILARLPEDIQRYVGAFLAALPDLPSF
jgi:hypothetical protein